MSYKAKDYTNLIGMEGFSETLLKNHFTLYQGYVTNTNKLLDLLATLQKEGKVSNPEYTELKRRMGFEFNGMRLHEYYFENLGGKGILDKSGKLAKKLSDAFDSYDTWEQAEGIITDEELIAAHKQLRSEEDVLNGQLTRLEEFSGEPSPPDRATFDKLANYWRGDLVGELDNASDELRAKFAEFFDLYITVFNLRRLQKAIVSI